MKLEFVIRVIIII